MVDRMDRNKPLLQVQDLHVEFLSRRGRVYAVRGVDFQVEKGQAYGLAGESGSGKSTIALTLLRYLSANGRVTAGRIFFKGQDLLQMEEEALRKIRGNEIAVVYQDPKRALNPSICVGEQIAEAIRLHQGLSARQAWERTLALLELVNIADPSYTARKYPHQLSGGMQQRVVIAMALSGHPNLLLMDEPTTGLDVTTQAKILDLITDLRQRLNVALLFITHDLSVIAQICDVVGIIYAGEMVEQGPVQALFKQPAHPYTRGLLEAVPEVTVQKTLQAIPGRGPDLTTLSPGCIFAPRCAFKEERCTQETVPLIPIQPGHYSKCFQWEAVRHPAQTTSQSARPMQRGSPGDSLLEAHEIKKYFVEEGLLVSLFGLLGFAAPSVKAVNGVSLTIRANETLALVGESGCGKSTLGRCLLKLLELTDGVISFRGEPVTRWRGEKLKTFRRAIQVVFQHPDSSLNPRKTVESIIGRPLKLLGLTGQKRTARIVELLKAVQLHEGFLKRFPAELSGGEKQRVAIARAFAFQPACIVLDEPTSALDVSIQASVINLLLELQTRFGTSYLFISHDLSVVRHVANRIGVMYLGKLCEIGTTEEVFSPPYHPYTKALLSAIPVLDPTRQRRPIGLEGAVPSARYMPSGCPFQTRCPRKIGPICEQVVPPLFKVSDTHYIACHIPLAELSQEDPVL